MTWFNHTAPHGKADQISTCHIVFIVLKPTASKFKPYSTT